MRDIKWCDNKIQIEVPKKCKKITGTRFATIMGLNPWSTEFECWCDITNTYKEPFEDTIYTIAGKTIEPKQADYIRECYGINLISPENKYGKDYFTKTRGDFFPDNEILGGMWDYLGTNEEGIVDAVFEMKTTKRVEDWKDDVPPYYSLQAALYAYLLDIDKVVVVVSFLEENDYNQPDKFIPSIENTVTYEFKVSEKYPNFFEYIRYAENWYIQHVYTGLSPMFDDKRDEEILKVLKTNSLAPDADIKEIIEEAELLKYELDEHSNLVIDKEKRYKNLTDRIKEYAMSKFRENDKKVELMGSKFVWNVSKSNSSVINKKQLEQDGLLEKYSTINTIYKLTSKGVTTNE